MSIWNLTSLRKPECIRILEHGGSSVTTCTFSACGRLLASGDTEGCCRLFEVCGWNPLNSKGVAMPSASRPTHDWFATHELLGHRGTERSITCLSFAVDSSMLASASLDTTVRLWQQQSEGQHSGKWRSSYCIHLPGPVNYIQFAPVGLQVLANCLNDDRAYIWDIGTILNQHDAWHYEVLDCGDNKDEIICSSAAW
jgi:WD40 repeat protein